MADYQIKKGEKLPFMFEQMSIGDTLTVPFRLFAEQTIRMAAMRAGKKFNCLFSVSVQGMTKAVVTMMEKND